MNTERPQWMNQEYPFRLAHTWTKRTLVERMQQMGMTPDSTAHRLNLLRDLAIAVKALQEKQKTATSAN